MKVSEIMSSNVGCCKPNSTIREAAQMMVDCDCGAIPIVEDDKGRRILGLVTDRDLAIRAVATGKDPNTTKVSDCMSTDLACVNPDANVDEAERIMEVNQVRRVPVVDSSNCLCGIVSQADIALSRPASESAAVVQEVSKPYAS